MDGPTGRSAKRWTGGRRRRYGGPRSRRAPLSLRAYGAWLRMLAVVSPTRVDRALARRFCAPVRHRARPASDLFGPARFVLHDGLRLPVWTGGAGPRVLLAHGWDGHGAFWNPVARALIAAGHEVVTFDMPAHGTAEGRFATVFDMAAALHTMARAVGPFDAVVGHSAGATATALAIRGGMPAGRAALIAAPALPATFIFPLADALGLRHERALAALKVLERMAGRDPFEADTVAAARWLTLPGLVVHDHDDGRAPWHDARAIADAWSGARLISTSGLGHYRLAADPAVIDSLTRFVAEAGAPAPAGEGDSRADDRGGREPGQQRRA